MPSVTVPGTNGSTITEVYGNPNSARLAQQISDALGAALSAHSLLVTAAPNPGFTIPAPTTNPGGIDELVISAGGVYSIPAATGGAPDYLVILNNTAPVTIFGGPNNTIMGGSGPVTIIDPATVVVPEGDGNATVILTAWLG